MTENDEFDDSLQLVVLDAREKLAKKIGLAGILASVVLSVITVIAIVGNNSDSISSLDSLSSTFDKMSSDTSWVPAGFEAWSEDSDVAYNFPGTPSCDVHNCVDIQFVSRYGCSSFYAAANYFDGQDGNVIGFDNVSLPSLRPLQVAKLRFEDITDTSLHWQLSEINCR